jgi:hypothetical protein
MGAKPKSTDESQRETEETPNNAESSSPKSLSNALITATNGSNSHNATNQYSSPILPTSKQLSATGPELPAVAESKSSSRKHVHTSGKARSSSRRHNRRENSRENKEHLLLHVKDIRSQQHMNATIDFVQVQPI